MLDDDGLSEIIVYRTNRIFFRVLRFPKTSIEFELKKKKTHLVYIYTYYDVQVVHCTHTIVRVAANKTVYTILWRYIISQLRITDITTGRRGYSLYGRLSNWPSRRLSAQWRSREKSRLNTSWSRRFQNALFGRPHPDISTVWLEGTTDNFPLTNKILVII